MIRVFSASRLKRQALFGSVLTLFLCSALLPVSFRPVQDNLQPAAAMTASHGNNASAALPVSPDESLIVLPGSEVLPGKSPADAGTVPVIGSTDPTSVPTLQFASRIFLSSIHASDFDALFRVLDIPPPSELG